MKLATRIVPKLFTGTRNAISSTMKVGRHTLHRYRVNTSLYCRLPASLTRRSSCLLC